MPTARPTATGMLPAGAAAACHSPGCRTQAGVYGALLPGFAVASLGIGAVFVITTTAPAMVVRTEAGLPSGVVNTFHEVGGSIGVAVVSTVAASGFEGAEVGGFTDPFTVCAVAAESWGF